MLANLLTELVIATAETLYMVLASMCFVIIIGLPLGTLLFNFRALVPKPFYFSLLSALINATRSIPFIILLVAVLPFTRFVIGTSIGIHAAMVPLILGAIPFFARLVDNVYVNLSEGLIETGFSMGMTVMQMIRWILLPEALPALIQSVTVTTVALINYSAMAGTVGGGGLGDLAIRYGYQRFEPMVMFMTVVILIVMVQGMQVLGDRLSQSFTR